MKKAKKRDENKVVYGTISLPMPLETPVTRHTFGNISQLYNKHKTTRIPLFKQSIYIL